ncbi:C39 family peptidase [Candidatus Woesearchaeota archaeon]|nr:C39 family peptidase [Candidatus Woesearchaeota archaeon]
MILNVPLVLQPSGSVDCGIAGVVMLLDFHGVKASFDECKKAIPVDEIGTYAPQLGSFLIQKGFDVTITTLHPRLFTKYDIGASQEQIAKRFEDIKGETSSAQDKKTLGFFIQFLKDGGKVEVKVPDANDITGEIKSGNPLCALLTSNFEYGIEPSFNFHFNIVTGISEEFVYVNDPLDDSRGGKKKFLKNDFFFGLYASAHADLDNACLIKVRKKA